MLAGDILIISELDRLGRSKEGILKELRDFKERGIRIMILEIQTTLLDVRNLEDSLANMLLETITNMLIEMFATLAEAEIRKKEQRQKEGYERLRRNGEWDKLGRPMTMSTDEFTVAYQRVLSGELTPSGFMKHYGLKSATYYRYRKNYENSVQKRSNNFQCFFQHIYYPFLETTVSQSLHMSAAASARARFLRGAKVPSGFPCIIPSPDAFFILSDAHAEISSLS